MIRLRCEIAIPSGLRRSRVFARLEKHDPETLVLIPAHGLGDATHQVVDAAGHPLITFLTDKDGTGHKPGERLVRDPAIASDLLRLGFWELPETVAILAAVRPGARIVDAGAHVGYYACLLARAAGRTGRVFAFEPDADNHRVLAANASLTAQLAPDSAVIETFCMALADRLGNVRLHQSDRNPGEHSLVGWPDSIDSRIVPAYTLDDLRWGDTARLGGPVDLLKADVPGSEFDLLMGAERTLVEDRPILFVTVRPAATTPDAAPGLVAWLAGRGYESFRLLPPAAGDPFQLVCDVARVVGAVEASEILLRRPPAPQLTLLAYPSNPAPLVRG